MMQTLLKERFKLEFHRETKQMPLFALVVGKNGPKLTEVEAPAPPPATPDGRTSLQARLATPGMHVMMSPSGVRLTGHITMSQLTNTLTRQLARPVLDETELTKNYDVDITWMPDNPDGIRMGPPPGGDTGEPGRKGGPGNGPEATMTLTQALQNLGLRLDARKAPAEVLIVDRAEKAPVEN